MPKKITNTIDLPDVAEFLKSSRRFIREIDLLDNSIVLDSYQSILKDTAAKVGTMALNYANKAEIQEDIIYEKYL